MSLNENTGQIPVENKPAKLKRGSRWLTVFILSSVLANFLFLLMLASCVPDLSQGRQFEPGLYVIDADGSNPTSLGVSGFNPRWSHDGKHIIYSSYTYNAATNNTGMKIRIINADGSESKIDDELNESFPDISGYSPDGKKKIITTTTNEIYVMQLDTGEKTFVGNGYDATWSNDGRQIIFTNNKDGEICIINADGSGLTELGRRGHACAVSPDGSRIVFVVTEWTLNPRKHGPDNLYLMNSDGSNYVRLTSSPTDEDSPAWSPDGKKIVFEVRQESRGIFSSGSD
jgi:Tol biopolymer transport system component